MQETKPPSKLSFVLREKARYCSDRRLPEMTFQHPLTLFIIRKNCAYDGGTLSNGLRNSAQFVVDMLLMEGIRAKLVEAVDGNSIDKLVHDNQPYRVVLEAIWVTPAKMAELLKLWPKVKWTIRCHSETPFIAQEGCAVGWIKQYLAMGIEVAFNSPDTANDFLVLGKTTYLPNYYPMRKPRSPKPPADTLNIGCFGAIRPLKNQLIQAFAAVAYAREKGKKLLFHMNGSRPEQNGANNLKNIQALLGSQLVLHPWLEHEDFLELIARMDMCLQVSLSESFSITASDAVSMGVPLVGSPAIKWLPERSQAATDSSESIVAAMKHADGTAVIMNQAYLKAYLKTAVAIWTHWN
jgi:glycosyltransferase involved in cell wall biosynthesis